MLNIEFITFFFYLVFFLLYKTKFSYFLINRWIDDATGLAPPCIAVLRSCHSLTTSLTAIAGTVNSNTVPMEIVDVCYSTLLSYFQFFKETFVIYY